MLAHRASRPRVVKGWFTILTILGFILPSVLFVLFSETMAFDGEIHGGGPNSSAFLLPSVVVTQPL